MTGSDVLAELVWSDEMRFGATIDASAIALDGSGQSGPSPVQLLAVALAGCMAMDIVHVIRKGRYPLYAFRTSLTALRAEEPSRHLRAATLAFHLRGAIPPAVVERAISLSRNKYCSVWHSLRQDIALTTSFEIVS